jgi:branched-chain amino acid transport system substrate-binding protein
MKKRLLSLLVLCVVALVAIPACAGPPPEETIKIGVIGPMEFCEGEHHWYGAVMARDEINEAGGVMVGNVRMPIELVKEDSNEMLSVPDAATAMEKAITVDKVDFLVGGFRTEAVLAMQDIAMDNHKIFIDCGASDTILCERVAKDYDRYKYFFRATPVNSLYLAKVDILLFEMICNEMKQELGIEHPKVALMVEKAIWADAMITLPHALAPGLGVEIVGDWRPSPTATDVTAELSAIKASGAQIILTYLSGPVGVAYAKQWGELEIPAASVGINVEAQRKGFWDATEGKGNYELTMNAYSRAEQTEKSIPFYDRFVEKWGEFPTYCAGTCEAIYSLKEAIERVGTLDSDAIVADLETHEYLGAAGTYKYSGMDSDTPHDIIWGPGYVTATGTQWQDGELKCVWPPPDGSWEGVAYNGTVEYKLPPWVVEYWQGK